MGLQKNIGLFFLVGSVILFWQSSADAYETRFKKIFQPDSTDINILYNRAEEELKAGDYIQARNLYQQALARLPYEPNTPDSLIRTFRYNLADIYLNLSKADSAIIVLETAIDGMPEGEQDFEILNLLGVAYRYAGNLEKALAIHEKALSIADSSANPRQYVKSQLNMATIYAMKGDLGAAFKGHLETIESAETLQDTALLSSALNSIGVLYNDNGDFENGRYYLERAYEIYEREGNAVGKIRVLNNLANSASGLGEIDLAIELYQRALEIHKESNETTPPFRILYNLGRMNLERGNLDVAQKYYQQSLKHTQQMGIQEGSIYNYGGLGGVAEERGNYARARMYYKRSLNLAKEMGVAQLELFGLRSLYSLEKSAGNSNDALSYYEQYVSLSDSLTAVAQEAALEETQTKLNLRKQQEINTISEARQREQQARLRTQYWLIATAVTFILIILIALYFLYHANLHKETMNTALQANQKELKEMNAVKDKILSIIAHDIRSPLSAMQGMLSLMKEDSLTKEEFDKLAEQLDVSLRHHLTLLDNLLLWAREQMKGLNIETATINAHEVTTKIINNYKMQATNKDISLVNSVDSAHKVQADVNLLELIFRNLVTNSIKFSNAGDTITISSHDAADHIQFRVEDTGIGMSKERQENIFSMNSKSSSGTANEKGSGLGLPLCKEFVEKQGGEIHVESTEGEGTAMVFTLPKP